jgi:hypothetical protein
MHAHTYVYYAQVDVAANALPFRVLKAERHSRRPQDYYTLTLLADVAAFVYAAITYRSEKRGGGGGNLSKHDGKRRREGALS